MSSLVTRPDSLNNDREATPAETERPRFVTTSWDDGDKADLRIADLLRSRGIKGTFYVPLQPFREEKRSLDAAALRELSSQGFEIGAHSVSHRNLSRLSGDELAREVVPCKAALEDTLGGEVRMFCYPGGRYNGEVRRALKTAGYRGARTVRMLATGLKFAPYEMAVSLQVYPHAVTNYMKNLGRSRRFDCVANGWLHRTELSDWRLLGKRLFDDVMLHGGAWHLYGHSWEIEQLGLWKELEDVLDYVAQWKQIAYVCNGDLLDDAVMRRSAREG